MIDMRILTPNGVDHVVPLRGVPRLWGVAVAVSDDPAAALARIVRDCAARDRPDGKPDHLPIVVLWGARGSESSELLTHLRTMKGWPAPRAHIDGEDLPTDLRPHRVANRLAFQLGQHVERFGRARFPRFFLGMQAVREPLDPDSDPHAREARRSLIDRQLRNRREGRRWLRDSAEAIAGIAGLPDQWTNAVGLAVDGAMDAVRTIALLRGTSLRWYREGLGRHVADPLDALVELSVAEFLGNHDWVDEVLCKAFVADLRGEFESGAGPLFVRRTSALVLLDNVSTPATRRFLAALAEQPDDHGPLLVVAASHLRFPRAAAESPAVWQPDDLGTASLQQWSQQRDARDGSRFYPIWVDPIDDVPATAPPTGPEIQDLATRRGLRPSQFRAVAFARRLTAAHPAGLDMVFHTLDGIGGTPGHGAVPARFDLRRLFDLEYRDGELLGDTVFDLVLGPWTDDMRRALALMGIAVDLSDASIAPILATENQQIGRLVIEFRERDLWVSHRVVDGNTEPPRLHPFARRAIAHLLGRAGGIAGLGWDTAHALLREAAATRDDRTAVLYHDVALGRIGRVATELTELFDPEDPQAWYDLLLRITSAPLVRPARAGDANAHHGELCAGAEPDTTVTRPLIAALQLHTDPLGDPFHDMCGLVAYELGVLSEKASTGKAYLLAKSRSFDSCWQRWHRR
jgi:hypothetical protein